MNEEQFAIDMWNAVRAHRADYPDFHSAPLMVRGMYRRWAKRMIVGYEQYGSQFLTHLKMLALSPSVTSEEEICLVLAAAWLRDRP